MAMRTLEQPLMYNRFAGLREGLMNFIAGLEQRYKRQREQREMGLLGTVLSEIPEDASPQDAVAMITRSGVSPRLQDVGMNLWTQAQRAKKEKRKIVVSPGQSIVDESGKVLYTAPGEKTTDKVIVLSPGQTAIDRTGNVLYTAPGKSEKPETVTMSKTLKDGRVVTRKNVKLNSATYNDLKAKGFTEGAISGQAKDEKPETTDMTKIENGRKKRISNVIIGSDRYNKYLRKGYVEGDIEEMGGSAKSLSEKYDEWVQARTKAGLITTAKDIDGFFRKGGKSLAEKFEEFKKVFRKNLHRDPTPEEIRQRLISDPFGILGPAESQQTPPPPINSYDGILTR